MPEFRPFDLGNVLATSQNIQNARSQNALLQDQLAQRQDPNSVQNQLLREQLATTQRGNKQSEIKFSEEQKLEGIRQANATLAQMMADPSKTIDGINHLKSKGILPADYDISGMSPDQVKAKVKEAYDGTKAYLDNYNGAIPTKESDLIPVAPGTVIFSKKNNKPVFTNPKEDKGYSPSPQAQKELFETDDTIQKSESVIGVLNQALSINNKAYSGVGAKARAVAQSNIPGMADDRANATIDFDNMMTGQALESLKIVFGGMPTEGERKILLDLQASVDKTPEQRKAIIDRAIGLVNRRLTFNKKKASGLRTGKYFDEEFNQEQPAAGQPKQQAQPQKKSGVVVYDPKTGKFGDE